eukprot:4106831-Heterocapsa_arctica.AAC.1
MAVGDSIGARRAVRVLVLPDYASATRRDGQLAGLATLLRQQLPTLEFVLIQDEPPLADDIGNGMYFSALGKLDYDSVRFAKGLRRDFMTSVASVMRRTASRQCEMVVGFGQGGVVVLGLTRPR